MKLTKAQALPDAFAVHPPAFARPARTRGGGEHVERIKIELSRELSERVAVAARAEGGTPHAYVAAILEQHVCHRTLKSGHGGTVENRPPGGA
jgi:hypothetical protein